MSTEEQSKQAIRHAALRQVGAWFADAADTLYVTQRHMLHAGLGGAATLWVLRSAETDDDELLAEARARTPGAPESNRHVLAIQMMRGGLTVAALRECGVAHGLNHVARRVARARVRSADARIPTAYLTECEGTIVGTALSLIEVDHDGIEHLALYAITGNGDAFTWRIARTGDHAGHMTTVENQLPTDLDEAVGSGRVHPYHRSLGRLFAVLIVDHDQLTVWSHAEIRDAVTEMLAGENDGFVTDTGVIVTTPQALARMRLDDTTGGQ